MTNSVHLTMENDLSPGEVVWLHDPPAEAYPRGCLSSFHWVIGSLLAPGQGEDGLWVLFTCTANLQGAWGEREN